MTRSLEGVLEAALQLSKEDRSLLVDALEATLDGDEPVGLRPEWLAEIRRRWREYQAGNMKTYTWEEVQRHAQEAIRDG